MPGLKVAILSFCTSDRLPCKGLHLNALAVIVSYYLLVIVLFSGSTTPFETSPPNWTVLDCVYFATVVTSTVGFGDLTPADGFGRVVTVLVAIVGLITFSHIVWLADHVFGYVLHVQDKLFRHLLRAEVIELCGLDGSTMDLEVPQRALTYYLSNLAPSLVVFGAVQLVFALLLSTAQPIEYGVALYHMMITSSTVGFGDIAIGYELNCTQLILVDPNSNETHTLQECRRIEYPWSKVVVIVHILLTTSVLSGILSRYFSLRKLRQQRIDRLVLVMRRNDPKLLEKLQRMRRKAFEKDEKRKKKSRRKSVTLQDAADNKSPVVGFLRRRGFGSFRQAVIAGASTQPREMAPAPSCAYSRTAEASEPPPSPRRSAAAVNAAVRVQASFRGRQVRERNKVERMLGMESINKVEFVVGTLAVLNLLKWEDALPIMQHFDQLDVSGDGVLSSEDLLQFGANRAQDVLRKQLKEQQEKLQRVASRAGVAGFSASNRGEEDRLKLAMNTRISRGLFSSFADGLAVPSASADDATERA